MTPRSHSSVFSEDYDHATQLNGPAKSMVEWTVEESGTRVEVRVSWGGQGLVDTTESMTLTASSPLWSATVQPATSGLRAEARFEIHGHNGELEVRLPYDATAAQTVTVANWQIKGPVPPPDPPTPPPCPPAPPKDTSGEVFERTIELLDPDQAEIAVGSFLWTYRVPDQATAPAELEYPLWFTYPAIQSSAFVQSLASLDGDGAAMRTEAVTFLNDQDLAALQADFAPLVPMRLDALGLEGAETVAQLKARATVLLGGSPPREFLEAHQSQKQLAWELLFAYALVPDGAAGLTADPLCTENDIVSYLRALRYLAALTYAADDEETDATWRRRLLNGVPFAPADVVPSPAAPTGEALMSEVRLAGVGALKQILQTPAGYQLGELAETISVMPGERLELEERSLDREEAVQRTEERGHEVDLEKNSSLEGGSLARAIDLALAAGSDCHSYDKLTLSYIDGTSAEIDGSDSGAEELRERVQAAATRFAREAARQGSKMVASKVRESRSVRELEERERIKRRHIDNGASGSALIGYYHWLNQVLCLRLQDEGRRVVIQALVSYPAGPFLRDLRGRGGRRLTPPAAPLLDAITTTNYLAIAADYGLTDLAPPPAETLQRSKTVRAADGAFEGVVDVPELYDLTSLSVAWTVSDQSDPVVAVVAGQPVVLNGGTGQQVVSLGAEGGCDFQPIDPLAPELPEPAAGEEPLATLPPGLRRVPISVLSNAGDYAVTVSLVCELKGSGEASAPATEAWLASTRSAIQKAYEQELASYDEAFAARVEEASQGNSQQIVQDSLRVRILRGLVRLDSELSPPEEDQDVLPGLPSLQRELLDQYDWDDMTYGFFDFPKGTESPCAEPWRNQSTRFQHPERTFEEFLNAGSARVLIPVRRGRERAALFFLRYGGTWPGHDRDTPTTALDLPYLVETNGPDDPVEPPAWTITVPTSLLVLSQDAPFTR